MVNFFDGTEEKQDNFFADTVSDSQKLMDSYGLGTLSPEHTRVLDVAKHKGVLDSVLSKYDAKMEENRGATGEWEELGPRFGEKAAGTISEYGRAIIPPVTSAAGAIIGTPEAPGVGTLAGGGLGWAIGEEGADLLDEWLRVGERKPLLLELEESAIDVVKGAAYEAGGHNVMAGVFSPIAKAVGPPLKNLASKIKWPFGRAATEQKAGEIIAANTSSGPWIAKNAEQAQALEETIPGLKFSRGQATKDPAVIKFERARAKGGGPDASQGAEQTAKNTEAIKTYIDKRKGAEGISDVIEPLGKQQQAAEAGIETAAKGLEREGVALGKGPGTIQAGGTIKGAAKEGKAAAKKETTRLFEDVPEFEIDATSVIKKIEDLSKPYDEFESVKKNIPEFFENAIEVLSKTGKSTPKGLQGLRREAAAVLREEVPDAAKKRAGELIGEIDEVMKRAAEQGGQVKPKTKGEPRVFYRGTNKGDKRRIETVFKEAEGLRFVAKNRKSAELYGKDIDTVTAKPDAKILYEGSKDFKALKHGKLTDMVDREIKLAKEKGYDAISFNKDSDIGTVIINDNAFITTSKPTAPKSTQATYKGNIIYPKKLEKELAGLKEQIKTGDQLSEKVVDTDKTYKALKDADVMGIMRQTKEDTGDYVNRLAKAYKIKFGKEAPTKPQVERPEVKHAKARKKRIEQILSEKVDIKMSEMEASATKLRTAQQYHKKEVVGKFKEGSVGAILKKVHGKDKVSDAEVVSKIFKPGAVGEQSAGEFMNSIGDNKAAYEAMESAVKQDLLEKATNTTTGEIVEAKLKGWLSKHKGALDKLGMTDKFDTVLKARKQLDKARELQGAFDKSVAKRLIGSDLETAVNTAMSRGSKTENAKELMKSLGGNKKAISGLQNAVIDYITTVPHSQELRTFDKMKNQYRNFKPVIDVIFKDSPRKLQALKNYHAALKRMEIGKKDPTGFGSDTFALFKADEILNAMAKTSGISNNKIVIYAKSWLKPFKDISDKHLEKILNRAALDPNMADTLMMAAKGTDPNVITRRLHGHMISLGLKPVAGAERKKEK